MRIGIDISQSAYEGTGVSRFTRGLIDISLLNADSEDKWTYLFSGLRKKIDPSIKKNITNRSQKLIEIPIPPKILSLLWNDMHILPVEKFTGQLDWFITSDWTEPPAYCKKATIVHDLTFRKYPETVHDTIRATHEKRLKRVATESHIVFCDSIATKKDLIEEFDVTAEKTVVNYPGVTVKHPNAEYLDSVKKKYGLIKPFVLAVGKIEPRKNLNRLIEAFTAVDIEAELIIVGPSGWDNLNNQKIDNHRVRMLGYVDDADLFALYTLATCFIFPSLYEGFGYPAVEAMLLGCPTALSHSSSLIEIGGNASVFFDPTNVYEIKEAISRLLSDSDLRLKCRTTGLKQASLFTWDRYYHILQEALLNHENG